MLSKGSHFTTNDLETIYAAAWSSGACNATALLNDIPVVLSKAANEIKDNIYSDAEGDVLKHPVVRLFIGHWAYLREVGLGPDAEDAKRVSELIEASKAVDTAMGYPV